MLKQDVEVFDSFESLVVASKLIKYSIKIEKHNHKENIYFAVTFVKNKKQEVHLDFSFENSGKLISICTCSGNCKSNNFSSIKENFLSVIESFRKILLD